jgi:hypothetical protein
LSRKCGRGGYLEIGHGFRQEPLGGRAASSSSLLEGGKGSHGGQIPKGKNSVQENFVPLEPGLKVSFFLNEQKDAGKSSAASRRSPAQCRKMTSDIVETYISLISEFFSLSSSRTPPSTDGVPPPLPSFVPPNSNALTTSHFTLKILSELMESVNDLNALELASGVSSLLNSLALGDV